MKKVHSAFEDTPIVAATGLQISNSKDVDYVFKIPKIALGTRQGWISKGCFYKMETKKQQLKDGQKVKYVGKDTVAYEKGKVYEVLGYDDELDLYGVMSELGEAYLLPIEVLEKEG